VEKVGEWMYLRADQISEFGPVVRIGPSTSISIKTSLSDNWTMIFCYHIELAC
jgi:hypothetical protein